MLYRSQGELEGLLKECGYTSDQVCNAFGRALDDQLLNIALRQVYSFQSIRL